MIRYAITSRGLYAGDDLQRQSALVQEATRWVREGIDFIQLREKDLPAATIAALARQILSSIAETTSPTRLIINSRADVAIATLAHGVHLPATFDELTPPEVRNLYAAAGLHRPIITVSCHTLEEIHNARQNNADAILLAPVFEKSVSGRTVAPGLGLDQLRAACTAAAPVPIYALGGVTLEDAPSCLAAGAAGIAGIRVFHKN